MSERASKTSIHYNPPKWGLPKGPRKGLELKKWTVDETYYDYKYDILFLCIKILYLTN